jgi:hypothetical protein
MNENSVSCGDSGKSVENGVRQSSRNAMARGRAARWRLILLGVSSVFTINFAASQDAVAARLPLKPTYGTDSCPHPLTMPQSDQVFIFSDANGGGRCRVLSVGLYPDPSHLGLPDNWMSSIWVGSGVRARLFKDAVYWLSGLPVTICGTGMPEQCAAVGPGMTVRVSPGIFNLEKVDFNDSVSSMRVERFADSPRCDDLQNGEIALFTSKNLGGNPYAADCIVQPTVTPKVIIFNGFPIVLGVTNDLPNPAEMGIMDNSLSSLNLSKVPGFVVRAFPNANYDGTPTDLAGGSSIDVSRPKPFTDGGTSSIQFR